MLPRLHGLATMLGASSRSLVTTFLEDPALDMVSSLIWSTLQATVTTQSCPLDWQNEGRNDHAIFCARYRTGKHCEGDSGGAAVADRDGDGIWVLYGIVSFSAEYRCSSTSGYLGYTHVRDYAFMIDFISSVHWSVDDAIFVG